MQNLEYIKIAFMFLGMFSFTIIGLTYFYFKVESLILRIAKRKTYKKITFRLWLVCKLASKPRPIKRISTPAKNTAKTVQLGRSKVV